MDSGEMMSKRQAEWQEFLCFGAHLDLRLLRDIDECTGSLLTDKGRAWVKERIAERQAQEQKYMDVQEQLAQGGGTEDETDRFPNVFKVIQRDGTMVWAVCIEHPFEPGKFIHKVRRNQFHEWSESVMCVMGGAWYMNEKSARQAAHRRYGYSKMQKGELLLIGDAHD